MIIVPRDPATLSFLREMKELADGRKVNITERQEGQAGFTGCDHLTSPVVEASRLLNGNTRKVLITLKGGPISSLDLDNWGTYSLRTYVAEPLRCFKHQRFRPHQVN